MKPMDHPDYEIAPGMFNLSAWSRENVPKGEPRFKVGDRVVLVDPLYIVRVLKDCDGTPLFSAGRENPADLTAEESGQDWSLRLVAMSAEAFRPVRECAARRQGTVGGNDPADCDWPWCGCDEHADKVLAAIQEEGKVIVSEDLLRRLVAEYDGIIDSEWGTGHAQPKLAAWPPVLHEMQAFLTKLDAQAQDGALQTNGPGGEPEPHDAGARGGARAMHDPTTGPHHQAALQEVIDGFLDGPVRRTPEEITYDAAVVEVVRQHVARIPGLAQLDAGGRLAEAPYIGLQRATDAILRDLEILRDALRAAVPGASRSAGER
jgi:hypothetical protein